MIKLVVGSREHKLTWRDGCFFGGAALIAGGLWASFGLGVVVAGIGALVASAPLLRLEAPNSD